MSAKKAAKKTSTKQVSKKPPATKPKRQSSAVNAKAALTVDEASVSNSVSGESAENGRDPISSGNEQFGEPNAPKTTGNTLNSQNTGGDPEFGASDYHFKVVDLATQLACAQMSAEASRESARLTISGIQRIASAFMDREYAQIFKVAAEIPEFASCKAIPLNHPEHDVLFEGAVIRAQRLLRMPAEDTSLIHAEQLFDAEETLSEAQIGERFKESAWPGLSNRADFYRMIVALEGWFHDHLGRLYFPEEDERFSEDGEMMGYLLDLGRRRQTNDLFRRIYELVREHELPNRPRVSWTSADELSHAIWIQHLIDVIFCGRRPTKRSPEQKRMTRRYYPWGLFRFLRLFGDENPVGGDLLEQLVARRNQLKANAIIHPLSQSYPQSYDFGPLDRLVNAKEQGIE